jgi:tRNA (mo5U34)-methyltransferase
VALVTDPTELIAGHRWWHTIDIAPGLVTPGFWDLRAAARRMPWPPGGLAGMRCLDVGTMDGFWAFEMERRGAAEVVAIDEPWEGPGAHGGPTFGVAAGLLGSRATVLDLDVHNLDPSEHGHFDLVFMGYVAELLLDPIGALRAVRGVCSGWLILLDQVSLPLSFLPRPLAKVASRPGYQEWFIFNRAGMRRTLEATGFAVEADSGFVKDRAGPAFDPSEMPWRQRARHALGLAGVSLAMRARPLR